jgi:small GTP-binding protein
MMLHGLGDAYHFSFSLCILGETGVGKSQLVSCTLPEPPQVPESSDVIADHGIRTRAHTYESRGARYQILMWEVPGAPRYQAVAARYASMAAGLIVVFDRSRRATFDRVALWLKAVEGSSPDLPRVLIGNKSDLAEEVSSAEAGLLAQQLGCEYFETCATKNLVVPEAFSTLIAKVVAQIPNPPEPSLLLRKRVQIGKQLAENKAFRAALFDMAS